MRLQHAMLWALAGLALERPKLGMAADATPAQEIVQPTAGNCSPAVAAARDLKIICGDSSETVRLAIQPYREQIDQIRKDAQETQRQRDQLKQSFDMFKKDSPAAREAKEASEHGDYAKAKQFFEQAAAKQEEAVDAAAETQFALGTIAMLQYTPRSAFLHYGKALQYRPDDPKYLAGYAKAAHKEHNFVEAERAGKAAIEKLENDSESLPDLARALSDLGDVYEARGRFADAETDLKKAVDIQRDLAAQDPGAHEAAEAEAETLDNLAWLYADTLRFDAAKKAFREALEIYRKLGDADPRKYQHAVAETLTDLASLAERDGRDGRDEEKVLLDALEIWRSLDALDPGKYRYERAHTIDTLASVYVSAGRFADAERLADEAIDVLRGLVASDPRAYTSPLAWALLDRAQSKEADAAETDVKEALDDMQKLYAQDRDAYFVDYGYALATMGDLYLVTRGPDEAKQAYRKAVDIFGDPAADDPYAKLYLAFYLTRLSEVDLLDDKRLALLDVRDALKAFAIYRELAALPALDPRVKESCADGLAELAEAMTGRTKHGDDVDKAVRAAIDIYRELASHDPANSRVTLSIASLYWHIGDSSDALKTVSDSIARYRDLADRDPARRADLAAMLLSRGMIEADFLHRGRKDRDVSRLATADQPLLQALEIYRADAALKPDVVRTAFTLGTVYSDVGRPADAVKSFCEALAVDRQLPPEERTGGEPLITYEIQYLGGKCG